MEAINWKMAHQWETEQEALLAVEEAPLYSLVVFNDDVNTFDHVINALVQVCNHTPEQAEQCTFLIHYKGKCSVKLGDFDQLAAMRNDICHRGISAEVL